jgi:uncharacterized protein (TIGR02145 family)
MKQLGTILFTFLVFGIQMDAFSQNSIVFINFTAENNGQYIPVDSIIIENLTQDVDTILYYPDTVLVLDIYTGINNINSKGSFSVSNNYPNPFNGKTGFGLCLPETERIEITVRNIFGEKVAEYKNRLNAGNHSFVFYAGNEKYYLLTVTGEKTSRTIKLLNYGCRSDMAFNCKLAYQGVTNASFGFKSVNSGDFFSANVGDDIRYSAYTDVEKAEITDTISANKNYTFLFDGWTPCPGIPTITDIDGNIYNTVQIGEQCWMKENLKTTNFNNGTAIPNVTDALEWKLLSTASYAWYDNNMYWKDIYGALYNWYAVGDTNGLCPQGWHIPSDDEWMQLVDYIGGLGIPSGDELKSCRQINSPLGGDCKTLNHPRWKQDDFAYGTDEFGFSGLPSGVRTWLGEFYATGMYGVWWSTTVVNDDFAWKLWLHFNASFIYHNKGLCNAGASVRCVKD